MATFYHYPSKIFVKDPPPLVKVVIFHKDMSFNPCDHSDLSCRTKLAKFQDQRVDDYFTTVTEMCGSSVKYGTTHHYDVVVNTLKECATHKHRLHLMSYTPLSQSHNLVEALSHFLIGHYS